MPRVSVVIPNFNYGAYIGETLQSALNQTYSDFELIVVDDGSTDNSLEIIRRFEDHFKGRLRLLTQPNQGVAVARNTGIQVSRGEMIAFLDADDIWLETTLEKTLGYLEAHPDCAMVYGNTEFFDSASGRSLGTDHGPGAKEPHAGNCLEPLFLDGNFIPLMTVLMRRSVFDDIGHFDTRFKVGEDLDLWMRVAGKYLIGYIPEVLTRVRRHGGNLTFQSLASDKANVLILKKCLRLYPELKATLPEEKIKQRYYQSYYGLGSSLVLSGKKRRGRQWLRKALRLNGGLTHNKIGMYFTLSYLPGITWVNACRRAWRSSRQQEAIAGS